MLCLAVAKSTQSPPLQYSFEPSPPSWQMVLLLHSQVSSQRSRVSATATHAGVLDFAAPDGHVGVPPKTMLSLVRGVPEVAERLAKGELEVRCRAVRLPTPKESSCALRPVAEGFHHGGADEAAVDLGAVLTKELGRGRPCWRGPRAPSRDGSRSSRTAASQ